MSNSLDPDQALHFVRPDLDPNCLQRLSADDTLITNRQRVNKVIVLYVEVYKYIVVPESKPCIIDFHIFQERQKSE